VLLLLLLLLLLLQLLLRLLLRKLRKLRKLRRLLLLLLLLLRRLLLRRLLLLLLLRRLRRLLLRRLGGCGGCGGCGQWQCASSLSRGGQYRRRAALCGALAADGVAAAASRQDSMSRGRSPSPAPGKKRGGGGAAGGDGAGARRATGKQQHGPEFEFGGPPGALATMLALPVVILFLFFAASKQYKFVFWNAGELLQQLPADPWQLWSLKAFLVVCGWMLFHVLLERTLFAESKLGVKLPTGERLAYNISGHLQLWVTLLLLVHGFPSFGADGSLQSMGAFPLSWVYDHYVQLATGAVAFSALMSGFLYYKSFAPGALLAAGGNTGSAVYDFFIGRELNPRLGDFDLKEFCELRPGLIGWVVINISCAIKQYQLLGRVTPSMVMINLFQGLYVWDGLYSEACILSTMDITTDGFGFMLCFGDLAWVPFTYSLQARYLVENSPELSAAQVALICLLKLCGYAIFRGSNSQKDAFRRDPNAPEVAHLETMTTKSGSKLIVSGWWGLARKINYTGDWMMGLAWSLTTGFQTPVTYFYPIYFMVLLVHRAYRDNHACAIKYGEDWPKYRAKVPYVFIPGVL
jgi:delta14-sterol reductase